MKPGPDRIRAFVAFEIDDALRERLGGLGRDLQGNVKGVRWVKTEGIHLTLRFLGDATRAQLDLLEPPLRAAAASCPRADAPVGGLGLFPERGRPRVLFLNVRLPETVLTLQAACENAAGAAGFGRESRPFRSHLTLGRWRDRAPRLELPPADLGALPLDTLVLFRSELRPTGAVYTPLATFPLAPP